MDFNNSPKKITLLVYYENDPSEEEKELMDDLGAEIEGMINEPYEYEIVIKVTKEALDTIDRTDYLLFARFEGIGF